ncbi:MAG: hypothetical protein QE273_02825 [Verrucomicrobiales bacterium]|nr:hypothetical protein [Verrucomicrobiales bacterium]
MKARLQSGRLCERRTGQAAALILTRPLHLPLHRDQNTPAHIALQEDRFFLTEAISIEQPP